MMPIRMLSLYLLLAQHLRRPFSHVRQFQHFDFFEITMCLEEGSKICDYLNDILGVIFDIYIYIIKINYHCHYLDQFSHRQHYSLTFRQVETNNF